MADAGTADVVVLTAIDLELEHALKVEAGAVEGEPWRWIKFNGLPVARRSFIGVGGRPFHVVLAQAAGMGGQAAAALLGAMVQELRPACIAMCGVCAGHDKKTRLGDVIVGDRLYEYDFGKQTPDGFLPDFFPYVTPAEWIASMARSRFVPARRFGDQAWWLDRPVPYALQESWALVQLARGAADLPAAEKAERCRQWETVRKRMQGAELLCPDGRTLTEAGRVRARTLADQPLPDLRPDGEDLPFQVHVAPIASGSAVREDRSIWKDVTAHMRKALGIEMEAAALGAVVRSRPSSENLRAIVMKGVMDHADDGRDDHFKDYAARASAECLFALLREHFPEPGARPVLTSRPVPPADPAPILAAWLAAGRDHALMPVLGPPHRPERVLLLPVDEVFVTLELEPESRTHDGRTPENDEALEAARGADRSPRLRIDEALVAARPVDRGTLRPPRLVLIGDPGAGKTSILRHLFGRLASAGGGSTGPLQGLHPVWVSLSKVEEGEVGDPDLSAFVRRSARLEGHPEAAELLLSATSPRLLLLLDGVDEIRDDALRVRVLELVNRTVGRWPDSGFVLTSRPTQWRDVRPERELLARLSRFLQVRVAPLDAKGQRAYVDRWFHAMDAGAPDPAWLAQLAERATSNRLGFVIANPLMLSALCALAAGGVTQLPENPAGIYAAALELLISAWHRQGAPRPPVDQVCQVLEPIAYVMQDDGVDAIPVGIAIDLVQQALARPLLAELRRVTPAAEAFVSILRDRCGVLAGPSRSEVSFRHPQFREYLAARHIARQGLGAALGSKIGGPDQDRWEETMLLAMGAPGVAGPFLQVALAGGGLATSSALLAQCVREGGPDCDVTAIVTAIGHGLARLRSAPRARDAADELRALFSLVDARGRDDVARLRKTFDELLGLAVEAGWSWQQGEPAVLPVTGMSFRWIPPGTFTMGSPASERGRFDDEGPQHEVELTQGYWLGTYPVTNAQYEEFVAATGHRRPETWNDRRFVGGNKPVVGVSWDDAVAFCAWVNARVPQEAGLRFRLPTEAEWERACRAGTTTATWVGDLSGETRAPELDAIAWYGGNSSGQTQPVGLKQPNPYGLHDMLGNAWEWCEDRGPYRYNAGRTTDPVHTQQGPDRVFRGGSWRSNARLVRAASRSTFPPDGAGGGLGFRLAGGQAAPS